MASSDCNLLDVQAEEELHRILCDNVDVDDESGDNWKSNYGKRGVDCSHDIDDIEDTDDIDGANEVHGTDDIDNGYHCQ